MWGASQAGGYFWTFGLLFFFVGSFGLVGNHFWRAYARSRTFYTLTDRRALVATLIGGKRTLQSYPINTATVIDLVDGTPGSVYFAAQSTTDSNGNTTQSRIGFEMIDDCRSVYARLREVQTRT